MVEAISKLSTNTLLLVLENAARKEVRDGFDYSVEYRPDSDNLYTLIYIVLLIQDKMKARDVDHEILKKLKAKKTWLELMYEGRGETIHLEYETTHNYKPGIGMNETYYVGTGIILNEWNVYTADNGENWDEILLIKVIPNVNDDISVKQIKKALLDSFDRSIVSDYDCTGGVFGGANKAYRIDDIHNVWMVHTSFGLDV